MSAFRVGLQTQREIAQMLLDMKRNIRSAQTGAESLKVLSDETTESDVRSLEQALGACSVMVSRMYDEIAPRAFKEL